MADIRAKIPGWREAIEEERSAHDDAYAYPYDQILGFRVRHLSLIDIARLSRMGNALFSGSGFPYQPFYLKLPKYHEQVGEFIAYMSTGYLRWMPFVNRFRVRKIMRMDQAKVYDEVMAYMERTFMDRMGTPEGSGERVSYKPNYWSSLTSYVDIISPEYGWTDEYIMQMPYRRLIQYVRKIAKRNDSSAILGSQTDKLAAEFTRSLREQNEQEEAS